MEEQWRDIEEFSGLYEVSDLGRVRNSKTKRILRSSLNRKGYPCLILYKSPDKWNRLVHRLVAKAFIPNPECLPEINHKDEIRTNNVWTNLEWCGSSYNNNFGTRNEKVSKKLSFPVRGTNLKTGETITFESTHSVKQAGFHQGHVCDCCNGIKTAHKGYSWQYINNTKIEVNESN